MGRSESPVLMDFCCLINIQNAVHCCDKPVTPLDLMIPCKPAKTRGTQEHEVIDENKTEFIL